MPKVHNIGSRFVQLTNFPYTWGNKLCVRGWTQEIDEPFRTSNPLIIRLPRYKALVFGRWTGLKTEEEAITSALNPREVTYDDFTEEAGWTPAPESYREESLDGVYSRPSDVDGTIDVYDWKTYHDLAKESERG
jgi:hypothetical protein